MRKLGQDPTEDELRELIISVDEGVRLAGLEHPHFKPPLAPYVAGLQ